MIGEGLWVNVIHPKYILPLSMDQWFRCRNKSTRNVSIIWKAMINAYDIIGDWMAWRISNGKMICIGKYPCHVCFNAY